MSPSETKSPRMPPAKPHRAGSEAMIPAARIDMWRSWTRYTGNQVRKNHVLVLMKYCPK
ncbi:MAG TPA: hypothetical protein VMU34_22295 [Mycobacterium sp.]|nr:hypothetical protein [Mycobacterium sp.]